MDQKILENIITSIRDKNPTSKDDLNCIRTKLASQWKINQLSTREILFEYQKMVKAKKITPSKHLEKLLKKADIRTTSGISVITSLVKPYSCPGKCVYCPTEVKMPKSYIATEPAAARALRLDFSPYRQMRERILMLERNGHHADKIEFIIKGGTWNAYPLPYQYWFILESFRACNEMKRIPKNKKELTEHSSLTELKKELEKEQRKNEKSSHRIIGLTLETRPDAIHPKTISHMRNMGATRIELGLQAPDDAILSLIKRGHTVSEFKKALRLLRGAGFKVDLHFMPDLPGTTPEHDVEMYTMLFEDPGFCPDMVKIYPNTVIPSAELYQWFLDGTYTPYGDKALFEALLQMKELTPRYCRISRLIRDIPAHEIKGGNTITNLRETLHAEMKKRGTTCVCLRCREISRQEKNLPKETVPELFVDEYTTEGGTEYFITFEDKKRIAVFGFLRLRIPESKDPALEHLHTIFPELKKSAFIRELHVYGTEVKIGFQEETASQHKGIGKKLMVAAEAIVQKYAKEKNITSIAVISGVGVRGYYRKLGYRKVKTYMIKKIAL